MLSNEEKKEMLDDSKNAARREHFRYARENNAEDISLDGYILYLNSVQKIFMPFKISNQPTTTRLNKL